MRLQPSAVLVLLAFMTGFLDAAERVSWKTSRVTGTPEPPLPFRTERVWTSLSFQQPTLLSVAPGSDRMFVGEQSGKLWSFRMQDDVAAKELVIDLKAAVSYPDKTTFDAFYGLAFDPDFERNRLVYLCYVLKGEKDVVLPEGSRVSRFQMSAGDPPQIDPLSEEILLTYRAGGHNGGCLEFGPDGYLYISTGDGAGPNPPDALRTGQDCSDLLSSILRIDVHSQSRDHRYAIPADNPFVGLANVRPEIWAFGLRNPWKMTFDRQTGELWVADVGWDQWEMVHWVTRGANFGWGAYEGRQPVLPDIAPGPSPALPPLIELPHTIAASVTGGYVYRGARFPELRGEYVFGDWETKRLWAAKRDIEGKGILRDLADSGLQVVAFGQDHAGELYLADYGQGVIHTLVRNEQSRQPSDFPRKLSETGLFADVSRQTPVEGVLPFEINQPQWSDYAGAERWLGLPGTDPIVWHPGDRPIPGSMFQRQYDFPAGAVLAKTLSLEMERGEPASSRKIETQLLHFDGVQWRGYTYAWNEEQTDAALVPAEGAETTLTVVDRDWPGRQRVQRWSFASRSQCLSCHTPWAQHALAFNPAQLHRTIERDGREVQQLQWLEQAGIYQRVDAEQRALEPFTAATLEEIPRHARQDDIGATSARHVRSYLHVNCSHCHRFNGGGAGSFELLSHLSDAEMKLIDESPRQGTFEIPAARLIAPGAPERSLLYLRMAKFGRGRMPHLGSEFVDEQALFWLEDWITSLAKSPPPAAAPATPSLDSLPAALATARMLGRVELADEHREPILSAAAVHPSALVQDLFAGFQPPERRRQTLGTVIRPETILALPGVASRGAHLFHHVAGVQCKTCHKLETPNAGVGPDLRESARKRTRVELLESLLEPSKQVENAFVTHIIETHSGRVVSGLIVRQDEHEVVLRDAAARETTISRSEIETLAPSRKSLMPEGLLRDLTAQEAADLVAYLESLKP
ncbi:MAG: PQQ-dependent sugar dehydrogenase [Planctomycetaceae bacterium]|nr:PQQ-dependent sugar dehydrogenase [Planctomycetaceae bacterium]